MPIMRATEKYVTNSSTKKAKAAAMMAMLVEMILSIIFKFLVELLVGDQMKHVGVVVYGDGADAVAVVLETSRH